MGFSILYTVIKTSLHFDHEATWSTCCNNMSEEIYANGSLYAHLFEQLLHPY
jgi:hypothetical protein